MIKFDFESYNNITLDNYNLDNIYEQFLNDKKMAGWYTLDTDLNDIKDTAKLVREQADLLIVVGIGGSYMGAKAIIEALTPYFKKSQPEIIFAGTNLSAAYLESLLEYIAGKNVFINVISKSGTTLESLLAFDLLFDYMKEHYDDFQNRIIVTTDAYKGKLVELIKQYQFKHFVIPDNIVGRYSLLSPVGLFPIAVAGYDIDALMEGARAAKNDKNNVYHYTMLRHKLYESGKSVESFNVYEPCLYYFTEWLKQLFAESQGKQNKGLLPISTVNTRDLHSLGQFFQDGSPIIFSTTLHALNDNPLKCHQYPYTIAEVNNMAVTSVAKAQLRHTPTILITLDVINEYNLGYLIFFFEMAAMLGSYLLGVNYYDQDGVNNYKEELMQKLNNSQ